VFDNDGTLWTEKPMPVQLDFIVRGFAAAAQRDPALRARQPYKAAHEGDLGWMGRAMVKHYQGDDGDLKLLLGALAEGAAGVPVEASSTSSTLESFDDGPQKPLHIGARTGRRPVIACGNSNGDLEMLRFAGGAGKPALRLVVAHDDPAREVDDRGGADKVLGAGFTEISMRGDWATVFAD
jgi:hypothetical protein